MRAPNQALGDLLAFHAAAVNATIGEHAARLLAHEVSGNYYTILGVRAQRGRAIGPMDDRREAMPLR
ncbi:MAG: hypothetical protein ACRD3J_06020 [Thermoanaerobaculia bacterium]